MGKCRIIDNHLEQRAEFDFDEHVLFCDSCYHVFGYIRYENDGDTANDTPRFCPNCGRRCVS